ncbi:MAG: tol-pal system protein YbgF [Acidobacteria bacterium]|nr:tol-pal system protein YbgF [Acidobacteriota bacterium]
MTLAPLGGLAVSKEIVRLQADMTLLQQQVRDLQKSFDTQNAVLQKLVEQLTDQVNILKRSVEDVKGSNQQTQAAVSARVESVAGHFSAVNSSLDLVLDRIAKLSQQLAETKAKVEVLETPPASAGAPPRTGPPSAEELYNAAFGDLNKGSYDLARQGFDEYLKNYPDTELSDNAQYWIGESHYIQRKFSEAIQVFDKVLTNYPKGDKAAAAALKKGYSLLEIKNNDAGIRELRQLIQKYPNSDSAQLAKDRLNTMGVSSAERPAPAKRRGNR